MNNGPIYFLGTQNRKKKKRTMIYVCVVRTWYLQWIMNFYLFSYTHELKGLATTMRPLTHWPFFFLSPSTILLLLLLLLLLFMQCNLMHALLTGATLLLPLRNTNGFASARGGTTTLLTSVLFCSANLSLFNFSLVMKRVNAHFNYWFFTYESFLFIIVY